MINRPRNILKANEVILLMRHGQDDDSRIGGWSDASLSLNGIEQVKTACESLSVNGYNIQHIFSSDLKRAKESADIVSEYLALSVTYPNEFREINNGDLAGITKERFQNEYPGLYYSSLDWRQRYLNGESPMQFYDRIKDAWNKFKINAETLSGNILLVSHAGVINIIRCIESGIQYTNKEVQFDVDYAEIVPIIKVVRND